ncbi:hypothetical protein HDU98_011767 [Podochytrium sp. JEL0797]|nr:hypothetical protein HDU98_011767 [Podochytrium sp. JEL0797]
MDNFPIAIRSLHESHGPAALILLQILGWISFAVIVLLLQLFSIDPAALCLQYNMPSFITWIFEKGGIWLVAYILNRTLALVRLEIAKALLPIYADSINKAFAPVAAWFGKKIAKDGDDGPQLEEVKKEQ